MVNRRKVVLLVEDDQLLRMILEDWIIHDGGFEVTAASDAEEAKLILAGRGEVDLVLSDQHMAGAMDGSELLRFVHHNWPSTALILMSGKWTDRTLPPEIKFVRKPVSIEDLLALMREMLSGPPPGGD